MTAPPDEIGGGLTYVLRLYITGTTPGSLRAMGNLRRLIACYPEIEFNLQVIDIYQRPELAALDQIVAAPTLVRVSPQPIRKIVGDLTNRERALRGLELQPKISADRGEQAKP